MRYKCSYDISYKIYFTKYKMTTTYVFIFYKRDSFAFNFELFIKKYQQIFMSLHRKNQKTGLWIFKKYCLIFSLLVIKTYFSSFVNNFLKPTSIRY